MKREFLKGLNLTDEQIDSIMAENGKDIEKEKSKFADYEEIKKNLEEANKTIVSFGDVDAIKADVDKWKSDFKKLQEESEAKIARMERQTKIKDFTGSKKFVNDFTRDYINGELDKALSDDKSKGKSLEDLLSEITKDKTNIFVEENKPQPPKVPGMKTPSGDSNLADKNAARAVMGLPPIGEGKE